MSPLTRGILITTATAAVAAAVGAGIGSRFGPELRQPRSVHQVLHEELRLSADQERRIASLEARFASRRHALEQEMRAANAQLAAAIRQRHAYSPEARAAVQRSHDAMGELQIETISHMLDMRAILTPDQATLFDRSVDEALTRGEP